jgi:hypothetical protein
MIVLSNNDYRDILSYVNFSREYIEEQQKIEKDNKNISIINKCIAEKQLSNINSTFETICSLFVKVRNKTDYYLNACNALNISVRSKKRLYRVSHKIDEDIMYRLNSTKKIISMWYVKMQEKKCMDISVLLTITLKDAVLWKSYIINLEQGCFIIQTNTGNGKNRNKPTRYYIRDLDKLLLESDCHR